MTTACSACLARTWLLERLAGHLEVVRAHIDTLLTLTDAELIEAVAGAQRSEMEREWRAFDPAAARARAAGQGVEMLCRCAPGYPSRLLDLPAPPAVLHVLGGTARLRSLGDGEPVGVVGARRPTEYGTGMAGSLGRGLGAAGVPVISGMARGIDAAAHRGALAAGAATIAVVPGAPQRAYPAGHRSLHAAIAAAGAVVSELGPAAAVWRWCFLARNRLIAALSALTVVVEGREGSGALRTAERALELGRGVGAVPGRVTTPQAAGPHGLLVRGASLVRGTQDVLDQLYGEGGRSARDEQRRGLSDDERRLLAALAEAGGTAAALAGAGIGPEAGLAILAELEIAGWVRRDAGGRFTVTI